MRSATAVWHGASRRAGSELLSIARDADTSPHAEADMSTEAVRRHGDGPTRHARRAALDPDLAGISQTRLNIARTAMTDQPAATSCSVSGRRHSSPSARRPPLFLLASARRRTRRAGRPHPRHRPARRRQRRAQHRHSVRAIDAYHAARARPRPSSATPCCKIDDYSACTRSSPA